MRIIDCRQQTEEWDRLRARPTASQFGKIVTPVKGEYSSQAEGYAAIIVAKRLGVYTEPPPTFWMEWGNEHEPNAKHAYTKQTGRKVRDVGFVLPDNTDAYGGSPDGLVLGDKDGPGLIEIKCPAPETLITYHADGVLPSQYKPQIQGLMLITGLTWCDFYAYHPELTPFKLRVRADKKYQTKLAQGILQILKEIARIESRVSKMRHELVSLGNVGRTELRWDDD